MFVIPTSSVYATKPIPVSGDIDATAAPSAPPKEAGIINFLSWATASVWSGTFQEVVWELKLGR